MGPTMKSHKCCHIPDSNNITTKKLPFKWFIEKKKHIRLIYLVN